MNFNNAQKVVFDNLSNTPLDEFIHLIQISIDMIDDPEYWIQRGPGPLDSYKFPPEEGTFRIKLYFEDIVDYVHWTPSDSNNYFYGLDLLSNLYYKYSKFDKVTLIVEKVESI